MIFRLSELTSFSCLSFIKMGSNPKLRKSREGWKCRFQKHPAQKVASRFRALPTQGLRQVCLSRCRNPRICSILRFGKIFQLFSRDFVEFSSGTPRTDPGNSHSLLPYRATMRCYRCDTSQKISRLTAKNAPKRHPPKGECFSCFAFWVSSVSLSFSLLDSSDLPLLLDILTLQNGLNQFRSCFLCFRFSFFCVKMTKRRLFFAFQTTKGRQKTRPPLYIFVCCFAQLGLRQLDPPVPKFAHQHAPHRWRQVAKLVRGTKVISDNLQEDL